MCIRDRPSIAEGDPVCMRRGNISVEDLAWYKARDLDFGGWHVRRLGALWCVSIRFYGAGVSDREVQ